MWSRAGTGCSGSPARPPDRVISTVDTAARHGHKSKNRRFDGYKAHLSVDPDSELIDEVAATAGNAPDRDAAELAARRAAHRRPNQWPTCSVNSAYGDAATRAGLEEKRGFHQSIPRNAHAGPQHGGPVRQGPASTSTWKTSTVTCPAGEHHRPATASGRGGGRAIIPRPLVRRLPAAICVHRRRRGRTIAITTPWSNVLAAEPAQEQKEPARQSFTAPGSLSSSGRSPALAAGPGAAASTHPRARPRISHRPLRPRSAINWARASPPSAPTTTEPAG